MPDNKYLRAIYACAREHSVSNEELHEAILNGLGKQSMKDLTNAEASRLLDGLRGKRQSAAGGASGHRNSDRGHAMAAAGRKTEGDYGANYLVNHSDRDVLTQAAKLRGWDEQQLQRFIARQLKGKPLRTLRDLNKVLWAVKSMNRRDGLTDGNDAVRPQAHRVA
jgi:hypothetical protein